MERNNPEDTPWEDYDDTSINSNIPVERGAYDEVSVNTFYRLDN